MNTQPQSNNLMIFACPAMLEAHKKWLSDNDSGTRADFRDADLRHCDLHNAMLDSAVFCGANLRGVNMRNSSIRYARIDFANLIDSNLANSNLKDADLTRSFLNYACLRNANLANTTLRAATLKSANLTNADLTNADLSDANLMDANLTGVDLAHTDLRGSVNVAETHGAPLYQVSGVGNNRRALTLLAQGAREEWRWFVGCFAGTEAELRRAVRKKYQEDSPGRTDYLEAIDYLANLATRHQNVFLPSSTPQP